MDGPTESGVLNCDTFSVVGRDWNRRVVLPNTPLYSIRYLRRCRADDERARQHLKICVEARYGETEYETKILTKDDGRTGIVRTITAETIGDYRIRDGENLRNVCILGNFKG